MKFVLGREWVNEVLRKVSESEPVECGVQYLRHAVERQLPGDPHLDLAAIPLELPRVQPSMGG